ncbi:16S rRNA (adenine1518-N6/adenine1519-N6)-dimethyltransferase [Alkalithermobacter thermoalcaliphilus JW-YL-7 = DSM 7308]|uniref:Ribosomal RNA small subunit methyltransferase A n=1 Tax=Alkalithermobacter thermoalcaliphilus JW-YL-7 = DSM 7308 TaxID=1121328 RepID=A0A150FTW6_CLOPD|nr:Ribosomal RNA small subunit methyltransferase A [[Clostridium] paradoxum JW-YL-7 = DSM 7308]SHK68786.1 16S rRNA (adenine1518-N6/adenine1519-N6)-dimethyltransferase [[Clostridium] paradoxum JW-YL-7 = DSM 7308]
MDKLSSVKTTKEIVERYGFKFSKSLGQNFLVNSNIIQKILDGAQIGQDDYILEVGPGIGTLTKEMAKLSKKVVAVEIDKKLIPILSETLKDNENVEVINEDILKCDVKKIVDEKLNGGPIKLVANLPYYITTPIVMKFLEEDIPVSHIVVMVQKEVADRMKASPGTKDYGALSVAVQYYSDVDIITTVPKTMFIPQPNVESTVIRLKSYTQPKYDLIDKDLFFRLVKASFSKRRKTILNALSTYGLEFTKDEIKSALEEANIQETRRGETLSIEEFVKLANIMKKKSTFK